MNERLLIVEDSEDDAELIARSLKQVRAPHRVEVRENGKSALDYIFGDGSGPGLPEAEYPEAILLDLDLPVMNGFEFLEAIKGDERTDHIPVIVFSASTDEKDVTRAYSLGANSYVRKPTNAERFEDAVKTIGRYWLMLNKPPLPEETINGGAP